MRTANNELYDETAIKNAEKRTESNKSKKSINNVKHFINSRLFKDLDFPPDKDELDDGIEQF